MSARRFDDRVGAGTTARRFGDRGGDLAVPRALVAWSERRDALRGDRGLITVLFGLFMASLLIVAAIVVDLGMDRATVRSLKTDTDLAAIAGGYFMAGNGQANDVSNPRAACQGIVNSIATNVKDYPSASVTPSPAGGCTAFTADASTCIEGTTTKQTVTFTGAPYVLTVEYPVYPSDIARPELGQNIQNINNSDADDGNNSCARMRITLTRTNPAIFAGIIGNTGRVITQSTTFKVNAATIGNGVPALLILERLKCNTINASGQGGIKVAKSGAIGGWIHSDTQALGNASISEASGTDVTDCPSPSSTTCTTNSGSNYSMYATALPSNGGPAITAEDNGTVKGVISAYAQAGNINGSIGCNTGTGINNATTGNPIVSRNPVDLRYNMSSNPNGDNITTLHARGYQYVTGGQTPAGGYGKILSGADCTTDNMIYKSTNVFVQCNAFTAKNVIFTGTTIVFAGTINTSGGFVAMPNAKYVYARGCNGCNNGLAVQLSGGGFLSVNSGVTNTDSRGCTSDGGSYDGSTSGVTGTCNNGSGTPYVTAADIASWADNSPSVNKAWPYEKCLAQRNGPGNGGAVDNQTVFATFGGQVNVQTAELNLCQTALYIGANWPVYLKQSVTSTTNVTNCSASLPCPTRAVNNLQFNLNPGSKRPVQWTAPLHNLKGPDATAPFDDLSLWTEASKNGGCAIAGQGAVAASGIFFMPNCDFSFGGQSDSNNPVNAQFICRTLTMAGQGVLYLKPNPDQSIQVPHPGGPEIIR